jgi:hypothetical protein
MLGLLLCGRATAAGVFFDDFSHADLEGLRAAGWTLRQQVGHPGVPGARWDPEAISLWGDPGQPGSRLLRLSARTDGTAAGTVQAQLCQARKFLRGTYAARIRFANAPAFGQADDPIIQAFYAISPLAHDLDPSFSEVDFEYLARGGWGSPATRLYAISWQTVQIEPWHAFNQAHERPGALTGWHQLTVQVEATRTRHFLDGRLLAEHGARNVPAVPMSINLSLWFSPGGLPGPVQGPRGWEMDLDWVFHAQDRMLSPAAVHQAVATLRGASVHLRDTVAAPQPALASPCNL